MLLLSDVDDYFEWRLTVNRKYSASSAYEAFSLSLSKWTIPGTCRETLCSQTKSSTFAWCLGIDAGWLTVWSGRPYQVPWCALSAIRRQKRLTIFRQMFLHAEVLVQVPQVASDGFTNTIKPHGQTMVVLHAQQSPGSESERGCYLGYCGDAKGLA